VAVRALSLTPEQMTATMRLISPAGEVYAGFFAFRRAAWLLPPMWAALPLLYALGASRLGPVAYLWIARHRYDLIRHCPGQACGP
jgi:hypothetical protein